MPPCAARISPENRRIPALFLRLNCHCGGTLALSKTAGFRGAAHHGMEGFMSAAGTGGANSPFLSLREAGYRPLFPSMRGEVRPVCEPLRPPTAVRQVPGTYGLIDLNVSNLTTGIGIAKR